MSMKKNHIRVWLVLAAVLVAYHAIVFLIPFEKTAIFWVSYLFTLIAFALAAVSFVMAFGRPDVKSRFYGFPIARIGFVYGLVQLLAGIVMMALGKWVPWWAATLLYVLALAAAVIGLVGADVITEEIGRQDDALKTNVSRMRLLQSKVGRLASQYGDPSTKNVIQSLAEALQFSDPVSNEGTEEIESELSALVDKLQRAAVDGNAEDVRELCARASDVLMERNRLCKLGK